MGFSLLTVCKRTAFYSLLAVFLVLTIKDASKLIIDFQGGDKKVDMAIQFNESVTFPNMTFCMTKLRAWSHFKMALAANSSEWDSIVQEGLKKLSKKETFLSEPWDFRMVVEGYQVASTLNSMERETTVMGAMRSMYGFRLSPRLANARKMIKMWLEEIKKRNVTFTEFQQKVGFETLKRSVQRFQRLSSNEDDVFRTRTKITWISQMRFCFQPEFDNESFKPITEQGEFFTLVLSHNAEHLEGQMLDCMTLDFHGRPTDLARSMEGKGRIKDGMAMELCLGKHEILAEVKAVYVTIPNDDNSTACKEYGVGDESEFDCKSRCRMDLIREMCNCTALTLEYLSDAEGLKKFPRCDYEKCIIDMENSTYTDQDCAKKCYADCTQTRFSVTTEKKGRASRPDMTQITLLWGSFEYLQMNQKFTWTAWTFFAALGGSIGLWLGLSILSLVQFVTWIAAYFTARGMSKKSKVSAAPPKPVEMQMTETKPKPKFSINPFSEAAKNPFESPFGGKDEEERRSREAIAAAHWRKAAVDAKQKREEEEKAAKAS